MTMVSLSRVALNVSLAALLAACGGSQPPIGPLGAIPQSPAIVTHAQRVGSWMQHEAASEDLLYMSTLGPDIFVYSYPAGKLVGNLDYHFSFTVDECSDSQGNVFVTNQTLQGPDSGVYEFAHGGTVPIYFIPYTFAFGCSVDATTGNLAVVGSHAVSIYENARGLPITYTDPNIYYLTDATYDGSGNLFIAGQYESTGAPFALWELPKGGNKLEYVKPEPILNAATNGSILWDGRYLAIGGIRNITRREHLLQSIIYRVQVSGSNATVIGSEALGREPHSTFPQFWIKGHTIVQPSSHNTCYIDFWNYPKRGTTHRVITTPKSEFCDWGTTISVVSNRAR